MSENKIDAGEARRLDYLRALREELVGYERHDLDDRAESVRAEIARVEAQAPADEPVPDDEVDEADEVDDEKPADEVDDQVDEKPADEKPAKVAREPKPRGRRSARRESAES